MAEQTLLERAAVIRDEQEEALNTAHRVGSALVLAAQEIAQRVTGIRSTSSDVSAWIHLSFTDVDGTPREVRIDLPVLTDSAAGVITPRQYQTLSDAIDAESSAREEGMEALTSKVLTNTQAIEKEKADRTAAEKNILARIAAEEQYRKKIDDELTARLAAEEQARRDRDDGILAQLAGEEQARVTADENIKARIAAETSDREAADDALSARIAAEEQARVTADENIKARLASETADREAADDALGTRIAAETADREAADDALATRLAAEEQARKADDKSILERITGEEQFRKKIDDELAAKTAALAQQVEELRRQHRADIDALTGTLDPEVIANMAEILMRLERLEGLLTL